MLHGRWGLCYQDWQPSVNSWTVHKDRGFFSSVSKKKKVVTIMSVIFSLYKLEELVQVKLSYKKNQAGDAICCRFCIVDQELQLKPLICCVEENIPPLTYFYSIRLLYVYIFLYIRTVKFRFICPLMWTMSNNKLHISLFLSLRVALLFYAQITVRI